ncbi:MAG: hypothetical protein COB85_00760 [Bacteroidetes bacterium]|nr:MAG: hypothetical protein COB85_00760 [Bacteroidota bacterium]
MAMKFSICFLQYNRIELLIKSLKVIEQQTYADIEVIVSDDCSEDDTMEKITELQKTYKFPLKLSRNDKNMGYDYNYRKAIELGTGEYCLALGNDDTIYEPDSIEYLVKFLEENDYPEIGYCNFIEENNPGVVVKRAQATKVLGSGVGVALNYYNGFSFVGGLIYKKSAFDKYNTSKHDGSIYSQMYLGVLMITSGCRLFTVEKPLVLKDMHFKDGSFRWSYYRDGLPKNWKEYRVMDGGLPSVANVLITAVEDATNSSESDIAFRILKRIYSITFPFWVIQYKKYGSYAAAVGLISGLYPPRISSYVKINITQKISLISIYLSVSVAGLAFPSVLFEKVKTKLYMWVRRNK